MSVHLSGRRQAGRYLVAASMMLALALVSQLPALAGPRALLCGGLVPFESSALYLERAIAGPTGYLGDIATLKGDNQGLRADNRRLRSETARLEAAGRENDELRRALDFERTYGRRLVSAQVVGRGPDTFSRTLTIDRGSGDGLKPGLVVVTGYGLVGRVREASPHAATIQTVADPSIRVNAYTVRSGLQGTVSGGSGPLRLEVQTRPDAAALPGEWVLTSGIGGGFPRGLVVGQVLRFDRHASAATELAEVAWANDLRSIGLVMVITDFSPQ
jgi:rod shape-determining protein MreC